MNYWIIHLRISTLLDIFRKNGWRKTTRITYIETTFTAKIFLKLTRRQKNFSNLFDRVEPRDRPSGPRLNLSQVRNEKGEVILNDVFRHTLRIRRELCTRAADSFKEFKLAKNIKSMNMMTACLGLKIAQEITSIVYMAHYIRWRNNGLGPKKDSNDILIIPRSDWSDYLKSCFKQEVGQVQVDKKHKALRQLIKILLHITKLIPMLVIDKVFKTRRLSKTKKVAGPSSGNHNLTKIAVIYNIGILKDQRNDLEFFHAVPISPERLLVYLKSGQQLPSPSELKWMKKKGIHCYSGFPIKSSELDIQEWKPSLTLKPERKIFYGDYLKTAIQSIFKRKCHSLWLLDQLWRIGWEITYWKDFFISNNIGLIIQGVSSEENFPRNLALSEIGGIAVLVDRSILFDFFTYIHNPPTHIRFVAGSYCQKQFPEPSFSLFTLQSGGTDIDNQEHHIEGITQLREGSKILISVFDETPSDWFFGDSVQQMYRALIDLIDEDDRFALLVKTKKPNVLERLPEINNELMRLKQRGKCLLADWKIKVSTASALSDLAVSLPSTAAFESVLSGKRTIVYNPMRSGSSIFYRNRGLNRRIFEDAALMVSALKKFADNEDDKIGDNSDIVFDIDPFLDGLGAVRVGGYIKACLDGFDSGSIREEILKKANESYASQWGNDKINDEIYKDISH